MNLNPMSSNVPFQNAVLASGILKSNQQISKKTVVFVLWVSCNFFFLFSAGTKTENDQLGRS